MGNWYFNDNDHILGPFNIDEVKDLLKEKNLNHAYFWRSGLHTWESLTLDDVIGIENNSHNLEETEMPSILKDVNLGTDSKNYFSKDVAMVVTKISGILLIFMGGLNLLSAAFLFTWLNLSSSVLIAYNIIIGLAFIFIGIGVIKLNKTAFSWAIGSSFLSLCIGVASLLFSEFSSPIIYIIFYIFIIVTLKKSEYLFE